MRAAHAGVALAVLGAAHGRHERAALPEALEDDAVDLDLLGALDERRVPGPVQLIARAHVDLGERAQEDVLAVDARAQPVVAQRARELDRGDRDRLAGRELGAAEPHR
jgi:hypothetical protein